MGKARNKEKTRKEILSFLKQNTVSEGEKSNTEAEK